MTVFLWSRDFEKHLKSDVLCIFLKQKIVLQSSGRWRKCIRIMLIACLMKSANLTDCCCNMQMETWWQLQLQSRPEVMRNSTACCSLWNALLALLFYSWEYIVVQKKPFLSNYWTLMLKICLRYLKCSFVLCILNVNFLLLQ